MAKEKVVGPRVNVTAGREYRLVGSITLREGMRTSVGRVTRIYPSGRLIVVGKDGWERRKDKVNSVTVTRSEARRWGYPAATGCHVYPYRNTTCKV